ncbi:MAG TPA: hypothetical protein VM899_00235 [Rubellimicrobium sp.]|jgi:hypothetical protein|nr:hypothetical protein [Rubellimicrobium sp.]
MTSRSTRSTVTFAHSFRLGDHERDLPAGDYEVVVEEELIQGLSFDAYRRTGSFLLIRAGGATEMRPVDPADIEAALGRDRAL